MALHLWGDESFDWKSLDDAIAFVEDFCACWGRFGGQAKEKWGEMRFYCQFGISLHQLVFPRYCYFKHPKFPGWLWQLDIDLITPLLLRTCGWFWHPYQRWIYREAHRRAALRYPHIKAEILGSPDFPELLEGL